MNKDNQIAAILVTMSVTSLLSPFYTSPKPVQSMLVCFALFLVGVLYCYSDQLKKLWGIQYEDPDKDKREGAKKDEFN